MLTKKELIKFVLYGSDISNEEYEKLIENIGDKVSFPSYDDLLDVKDKYKITEGIIYLDEVSPEKQNMGDLLKQIKESSYDLRLGKQYLIGEKIYELDSNKKPILKIPPHDVAVVLTYECLRIPTKVIGSFQLNLDFVLKGLLLANGAFILPGYKGKLACVLFNLTNKPILLKYKDSFAKISFLELTDNVQYQGKHQGNIKIQEFIKDWMPVSGLADINEQLEVYHRDLEGYKKDIDDKIRNATIIVLTILTVILTFYGIFGKSP